MSNNLITGEQAAIIASLQKQAGLSDDQLDEAVMDMGTTLTMYHDASRLIRLLDCYIYMQRLAYTPEKIKQTVMDYSANKKRVLWQLSAQQAAPLHRGLVVELSKATKRGKVAARKRFQIATYERIAVEETDDQKAALDKAYLYQEDTVRVVFEGVQVVRIFYEGKMYERVNLQE